MLNAQRPTIRASARLRVTVRKIQRKLSRNRGTYTWTCPQVRLSNNLLVAAGINPMDFVLITVPKPGFVVLMRDPDQRETKDYKRRRKASRLVR
jgi:hypothetical protein